MTCLRVVPGYHPHQVLVDSGFGHLLLKVSFYPSSQLAENELDRSHALAVARLQRGTGSRMVVFTDSPLDEERAVAHNSEPCSCFQPRLPQLYHNKNSPFLVDSPHTTKPHISSSPSTSLPFNSLTYELDKTSTPSPSTLVAQYPYPSSPHSFSPATTASQSPLISHPFRPPRHISLTSLIRIPSPSSTRFLHSLDSHIPPSRYFTLLPRLPIQPSRPANLEIPSQSTGPHDRASNPNLPDSALR